MGYGLPAAIGAAIGTDKPAGGATLTYDPATRTLK